MGWYQHSDLLRNTFQHEKVQTARNKSFASVAWLSHFNTATRGAWFHRKMIDFVFWMAARFI